MAEQTEAAAPEPVHQHVLVATEAPTILVATEAAPPPMVVGTEEQMQTHRGPRTNLSPAQVSRLVEVFRRERYPSGTTQDELSRELGIPARAVYVWFQNRRARTKSQASPVVPVAAAVLDYSEDARRRQAMDAVIAAPADRLDAIIAAAQAVPVAAASVVHTMDHPPVEAAVVDPPTATAEVQMADPAVEAACAASSPTVASVSPSDMANARRKRPMPPPE